MSRRRIYILSRCSRKENTRTLPRGYLLKRAAAKNQKTLPRRRRSKGDAQSASRPIAARWVEGSGMVKALSFQSDQQLEGSLLVQMPNRRLRDTSDRVKLNQ